MADMTSTTSMPSWVQPYAAGFLNRAQQVADTPYQAYTGQMVAPMNQWQQQGLQAQAQRAMTGSPVTSAAQQNITSTLNGDFLGQSNPYLNSQIQAAQGDLTTAWNNTAIPSWSRAMQGSGSFGNSGVMQAQQAAASDLQKNLGRVSSDMRFNAYNTERQNQMSALGLAPSIANQDYADIAQLTNAGNAYQTQQQKVNDADYQQYLRQMQYPQQQLDIMRSALGGVNFGNTTTTPGPSTASQLVGGALTGASLYNLLFGG